DVGAIDRACEVEPFADGLRRRQQAIDLLEIEGRVGGHELLGDSNQAVVRRWPAVRTTTGAPSRRGRRPARGARGCGRRAGRDRPCRGTSATSAADGRIPTRGAPGRTPRRATPGTPPGRRPLPGSATSP